MSHFDEDGNFIEERKEEPDPLESDYKYIFKENKED